MSEARPAEAPCELPVSTRVAEARLGGAAALAALAELAPPAIFLEGATAEAALAGTLGSRLPRVLGMLVPAPAGEVLRLDHPDDPRAEQAALAALRAQGVLRRWAGARLVLPLGAPALPGLAGGHSGRALPVSDRDREAAADRLARRLHALARRAPDLPLALLPAGGPGDPLDPRSLAWVQEDLGPRAPALALDLGLAGLGAAEGGPAVADWLGGLGPWLALVFLADHDGRARSDLLPGVGLLPWAELRELLADRGTPVLRGDPGLPASFLRGAERHLTAILGRLPGAGPRS